MTLVRTADGFSSADVEGMGLDPQSSDPAGYQTPRDLGIAPDSDGQDPATPGGPAPYNGAEPTGKPVTSDPMWKSPDEPEKPPYSPTPYLGPGPSVDTTTLHNARRTPVEETMAADLWVTASQDVAQELEHERMVRAKVAASAVWPFLSVAQSESEFGHRLALCEEQLDVLFPEAGFRDQVTASLREDYRMLNGIEITDHGTSTLTTEASAVQDGGLTVRASILGESHEDLFHYLAVAEPDEPESGGGASPTNPDYFAQGPEAGPLTGDSGHFEQGGPDPYNPMNAEYPMTPGQWTVPPDAGWVDRPMQFGHQASAGYTDEGVQTGLGQNPDYFGAPEGVTNGQDGFPPDVSLPEADERVDMYGQPPAAPQPAQTPSYSNSHAAARWVTAEKDNHGACAHCNSPVYREGDTWKHLSGNPGHGVRLHEDHPWLVAEQGRRTLAARTAEYQYVKPNPQGSGFVVTQKGTGKVLSHHDTEEDAQASFRAMMMHKHEGQRTAHWVTAEATSSDASTAAVEPAQADPSSAPPTPQSMQQGGAGAVAGTPLTIPNQGVGTNPFATPGGGPETAGAAPGANPYMASQHTADTMNRPTVENPSGAESNDEFDVNTWDNPANQRPRQKAEDRGINTPQRPRGEIPITQAPAEEEDAEEERR